MNFGDTLDSIREINFMYLSAAQRLLQADKAAGMRCFGLSPETADVIAVLSLAQLMRLAASSQILCVFGQRSGAVLAMLARDERSSRDVCDTDAAAGVAASAPLPSAC
jgi:flagellar transcriptional activator FlhD